MIYMYELNWPDPGYESHYRAILAL